MPTVKRVEGFSIRVLTRDEHCPPHVHVKKAGADVRVKIAEGSNRTGIELWDVTGKIADKDVDRAVVLVTQHADDCRAMWREKNAHLGGL